MSSLIRARTLAASLVAVLALGGVAACGSDSDSGSSSGTTAPAEGVSVSDVWARESTMSSEFGAVYFAVTNGGAEQDELVAASVPTDIAAEAQIHETVEAPAETTMSGDMSSGTTMAGGMSSETTMAGTGMMTMQEVASVPVPAGGSVAFAPGGYHVMLLQLAGQLEPGQTFPVTLTFANAGEITVTAEVRAS